jgi:hypothetical protein
MAHTVVEDPVPRVPQCEPVDADEPAIGIDLGASLPAAGASSDGTAASPLQSAANPVVANVCPTSSSPVPRRFAGSIVSTVELPVHRKVKHADR